MLVGAIGMGAVAGAFALAPAKARIGADRLVEVGTIGTAIATLLAVAREPFIGLIACVVAGASWIAVLATFSVSAQAALPEWVRGRGLAAFASVQFAGLTLGSVIFGFAAHLVSLPASPSGGDGGAAGERPLDAALASRDRRRPRSRVVHALAGARSVT